VSGAGITVWLSTLIELPSMLSGSAWSTRSDGVLERSGTNYILSVFPPRRVFSPDVPDDAAALVPGIAWLVEIGMEGHSTRGDGELMKLARQLARAGHGVIDDGESVKTPTGVRRYHEPARSALVDELTLGWWAQGGPLVSKEGLNSLLAALVRVLPEAVPQRWGLFEPPDHSLAEEGTVGLVEFIDSNRVQVTDFPGLRPPGRYLTLYTNPRCGTDPRDSSFDVTHLKVDLDAQLLDQPGWGRQLAFAFEELSKAIEPFYGEARILRGVSSLGPHAFSYGGPGRHDMLAAPVYPMQTNSWWGLPVSPPFAAVLGRPYSAYWPDFGSHRDGDLLLAHTEPWPPDPASLPWAVPNGLQQEFDCHWARGESPPHAPAGSDRYTFSCPTVRPDIWPFQP
jgi:hypothetical protein